MVKFDVVVGNPPYQEDTEGTSAKQIYPLFMDAAYDVSDKTCLITPGRFLFNAGKTSKKWNNKMLNDKHLKVINYTQNSAQLFSNTDIKGGVVITYRDTCKTDGLSGIFTPHRPLQTLLKKTQYDTAISKLSDSAYSSVAYKLTDELHSDYPDIFELLSHGNEYEVTTNIFEKLPHIFLDNLPENKDEHVQVYGRTRDNGRSFRWVKRGYIKTADNFTKWKVFLPKSNGSGMLGESLSTPLIGEPLMGHTQTFMSFGCFDTEYEAHALMNYIKSKFSRALLGVLKVTQDNPISTWSKIPLQDFTKDSDIDWSKSIKEIDQQLYAKYGLSEEEITFIETHVKEME